MEKFNPKNIYPESIPSEYENVLDNLTKSPSWDFERFEQIILRLGLLDGHYIPARNAPEEIHCDGWDKTMIELLRLTEQYNNEFGRAVRVDLRSKGITMGQITQGDDKQIQLDMSKDKGKEGLQKIVGTLHTHPGGIGGFPYGLSGQDFIALIANTEEHFSIVLYGEESSLMVLKTSVTPSNLPLENIQKRIQDSERDYLRLSSPAAMGSVIDFNRIVCTEFGLVMYMAKKENPDLFRRISVAV